MSKRLFVLFLCALYMRHWVWSIWFLCAMFLLIQTKEQFTEPLSAMPKLRGYPMRADYKKQPCTKNFREPLSLEESTMLAQVNEKAREFIRYVQSKYPQHPLTHRLDTWNGDVKISTFRNGSSSFTRDAGCLVLNLYEKNPIRAGKPGDTFRPMGSILYILLHELSHAWAGPHDAVFYEAYRWYLRVATEELGWIVIPDCKICCYSATDACTKNICPRCIWKTTCPKQPPSGQAQCGTVLKNES